MGRLCSFFLLSTNPHSNTPETEKAIRNLVKKEFKFGGNVSNRGFFPCFSHRRKRNMTYPVEKAARTLVVAYRRSKEHLFPQIIPQNIF